MKGFVCGFMFAGMVGIFSYTMYEAGKAVGHREARRSKRLEDAYVDVLKTMKKKFESK